MSLIHIYVFEGDLTNEIHQIDMPAVPRAGETLTLPDTHYVVQEVFWQANQPTPPPKGYEWPENLCYIVRLIVKKKEF